MSALRTIRKAHRLTLADVALRAGVTKSRLWEMERRPPKLWNRLARLADVLGCSTDEVLGRVPVAPGPVDALARADQELLDVLARDAEALLGPQVLKLAGGWRPIARMAWLGVLFRIRAHGQERPRLAPPAPDVARAAQRAHVRRRAS